MKERFDVYSFATRLIELEEKEFAYEMLMRDHEALKKKYAELLNSSVKHNEQMVCGWLDLLTSDSVEIKRK